MGLKNYSRLFQTSDFQRHNVCMNTLMTASSVYDPNMTLPQSMLIIDFVLDHIAKNDNYIIKDKYVAALKLSVEKLINNDYNSLHDLYPTIWSGKSQTTYGSLGFLYAFSNNRNVKDFIGQRLWKFNVNNLMRDINTFHADSLQTEYFELYDFLLSCKHICKYNKSLEDGYTYITIADYGRELYKKLIAFDIDASILTSNGMIKSNLQSTLFGTGIKRGRKPSSSKTE